MNIIPGHMTDRRNGPLVVFPTGMRFNHSHKPGRWVPVLRAIGR